MDRKELLKAVSEDVGVSEVLAKRVLRSIVRQIAKTIVKGEAVIVREFGRFTSAKRAQRWGRHPKTGARYLIRATTIPKFVPAPKLKAHIAAKGSGYVPKDY